MKIMTIVTILVAGLLTPAFAVPVSAKTVAIDSRTIVVYDENDIPVRVLRLAALPPRATARDTGYNYAYAMQGDPAEYRGPSYGNFRGYRNDGGYNGSGGYISRPGYLSGYRY